MVVKIFTIFFVSIAASFFPFIAAHFFNSPLLHGFVSGDVFLLILFLLLPLEKKREKIFFVVLVAFVTFFLCDSIDVYITLGIFLLIYVITLTMPRRGIIDLFVFISFALFFAIIDWCNFFYSTFVLSIQDVWNLARFFWWGIILFIAVPLIQILLETFFVRNVLWRGEVKLSCNIVILIALIVFAIDFGVNKLQQRQPILDFAVYTWVWRLCNPDIVSQSPYLQENIKSVYPIWKKDKAVINDFEKPTVVVLVESFGVNKSVDYTKLLFAPFLNSETLSFAGLYLRESSHTQGAELEDFGKLKNVADSTLLPQKFKNNGIETWYLHGYEGSFYDCRANYAKYGFDSLYFKRELKAQGLPECFYGFKGICDTSIVDYMDSLLNDSVPKFIYWTTLDGHPPYEFVSLGKKSNMCATLKLDNISCTYLSLQQNTMNHLVALSKRHTNYRFVIRGDHRPMGTLEQPDFVQSFYFRWVPLIILN